MKEDERIPGQLETPLRVQLQGAGLSLVDEGGDGIVEAIVELDDSVVVVLVVMSRARASASTSRASSHQNSHSSQSRQLTFRPGLMYTRQCDM